MTARRTALLVVAVGAVGLLAAALVGVSSAAPSPAQQHWGGTLSCTTSTTGYCTVLVPAAAGVPAGVVPIPTVTPRAAAIVSVDTLTAASFRVRFAKSIASNGTVTAFASTAFSFSVSLDWDEAAPPPTTVPPTTVPPTTVPPTTTPAPTTTPPPGQTWPDPGTVGFLGDPATLTPVDAAHPGNAPANCAWSTPPGTSGYLRCDGNVTITGLDIGGGVDIYNAGTVTISGSRIRTTQGDLFQPPVWLRSGGPAGCSTTVTGSTLGVMPGSPAPVGGEADVDGGSSTCKITVTDSDLSGRADGFHPVAAGSALTHSYIHALSASGTQHNDGEQYSADNLLLQNNNIDIGWDGTHQNAAVFLDGPGAAVQVTGNRLSGGGYIFRNAGATGTVVTGNLFVPVTGQFGDALLASGSIATWSGNTHPDGSTVPSP